MKKQFYGLLLAAVFLSPVRSTGQHVVISDDNLPAHPRALLDLRSSSKGLLIPRMDHSSKIAIPHTKGLLVYDSSRQNFWYNSGAEWLPLESGLLPWLLSGNSGISQTDFIGTGDSAALKLKVNNLVAGFIDSATQNSLLGYNVQSFLKNGSSGNTIAGSYEYNSVFPEPPSRGEFNTAIGGMPRDEGGMMNTGIGNTVLAHNTTGSFNAAFGMRAVSAGDKSTGIGYFAIWNSNQHMTTAVGKYAFLVEFFGSGPENTALGHSTFVMGSGRYNTANGPGSNRMHLSAVENTTVGYQAGNENTTGFYNTAIGHSSLKRNESGSHNTSFGKHALLNNDLGEFNTAFGTSSMEFPSAPSFPKNATNHNSAIGALTLQSNFKGLLNSVAGFNAHSSGSTATVIGTNSLSLNPDNFNSTAIGFSSSVSASNKVRIGNTQVTSIEGQVPFTTPSDARFKYNIQEDIAGLDFILKLRPVIYELNISGKASIADQGGFIAQEVEKAAKYEGYEFSGLVKPRGKDDYYKLSYELFVVPLVKAIQERQQQIIIQQQRIEERDKQLAAIQEQIQSIRKNSL